MTGAACLPPLQHAPLGYHVAIYGRAGVVAHALVDAEDMPLASRYRWYLMKGYVGTSSLSFRERRTVRLHRLIMGVVGAPPNVLVDHINGDRLDNRKGNLRLTDARTNPQNVRAHNSHSSHRGVTRVGAKWRASCMVDGQSYHIGLFAEEEEAALAAAIFRAERLPFSRDAIDTDLRVATMPARVLRSKSSTFRGVSKHKNRWRAFVVVDGGTTFLGLYATEAEAGAVAAEGRRLAAEGADPRAAKKMKLEGDS